MCELGYIKKGKYENDGGSNNNVYYIKYIVEEKIEKEIEVEGEDEKVTVVKDVDEEDIVIDTTIEYKDINK